VNVLSKVRIEKFAARAQAYICTNHHLDQMNSDPAGADAGAAVPHTVKQELAIVQRN
jgi:hypothetical protein